MTTPSGLQERLQNCADAELKTAVRKATVEMTKALNALSPPNVYASWAEIQVKVGDKTSKYSYDSVIKLLENSVIRKLQEKYREKVIQDFMSKVDTLHDQMDELRDEINYGQ